MARKKNPPALTDARDQLAARLHDVRVDRFGKRSSAALARLLGVPVRTWYNYEGGVTVPADILLRFLEITGAEPRWLLSGAGPRYRTANPPQTGSEAAPTPDGIPAPIQALLAAALRCLARGELRIRWEFEDDGSE